MKDKEVSQAEFKKIRNHKNTKRVGIVHGKQADKKNGKDKYQVIFNNIH